MTSYNIAETYNGHDLLLDVYLNTGAKEVLVNGVPTPAPTHSIVMSDNGVPEALSGIESGQLIGAIAQSRTAAKSIIDNSNDPALIAALLDAGLTEITGLDKPANLTTDLTIAGYVYLLWDDDGVSDNWLIEQSETEDFADFTQAYSGVYANSVGLQAGLTTGEHWYFRVIAQLTGVTNSVPSYTGEVVVP